MDNICSRNHRESEYYNLRKKRSNGSAFFLLTIHMDEKLMSSTTNDREKENASQKNKMFKHNPVRFVFAIGSLHIIVSIALSLYALYH